MTLFGVWRLTDHGKPVHIPATGQRLLTLLALTGPHPRAFVAGTIWPEADERRALGSLRTTLWRMHSAGPEMVKAEHDVLMLCDGVKVDVHEFVKQGEAVIRGLSPTSATWRYLVPTHELLPGWYDDWVLLERERLRQLRLHALEVLAERLVTAGRTGEALEAAMQAVAIEPLRESAQRLTIRVHLAEGNLSEALRQFDAYRDLVRQELGVPPSERMRALVSPLLRTRQTRRRAMRQVGRERAALVYDQPRVNGRPADQVSATRGTPGR